MFLRACTWIKRGTDRWDLYFAVPCVGVFSTDVAWANQAGNLAFITFWFVKKAEMFTMEYKLLNQFHGNFLYRFV